MPTPDDQSVIALYERWVKAGPPPLGVSLARWWDRRLVELRDAIVHRNDANNAEQSARTTADNSPTSGDAAEVADGPTVREAAADDRRWPLERDGE